jgi:transposase-like protein
VAGAVEPQIDLVALFTEYGSDEACRAYLEALRWPDGVDCPNCGGRSISRIKTRKQFDCNACRKRFSVTTGTVFHGSHLSLPKWFAAVFLMTEAEKRMSASQLGRTLDVAPKTASYLCHRIPAATGEDHAIKRRKGLMAKKTMDKRENPYLFRDTIKRMIAGD